MNTNELATRLARQSGLSRAAAADQLDEVIHDILSRLRRGKPARIPGLGAWIPGQGFRFDAKPARKPARRK